jgi:short subunit dehydrogenase-like uncharacterized protein
MPWLVYGANGYTGELIARKAAEAGLAPVLAGRSRGAVEPLARELGLESRVFGLEAEAALDDGLRGASAVLHCAGPFSRTSRPMADACLRLGRHYMDITGEVEVFESLAARDAEARSRRVMLLPGAGFDVVPSDCLAAHLKRRLPTATRLALGFQSSGRLSRGTATTMIENSHRGGLVRRGGALVRVPAAYKTRVIDFGRGPRRAVTIPWGDVSTASHSTGIPDVEVYMAVPRALRLGLLASRFLRPVLRSAPVQRFLKRRIQAGPRGPSAEHRARGQSLLWGEATDAAGNRAEARLRTPEGYELTALTALAIVKRVLAGDAPPGFQTPSRAYGADFILGIPGCVRTDEDVAGTVRT